MWQRVEAQVRRLQLIDPAPQKSTHGQAGFLSVDAEPHDGTATVWCRVARNDDGRHTRFWYVDSSRMIVIASLCLLIPLVPLSGRIVAWSLWRRAGWIPFLPPVALGIVWIASGAPLEPGLVLIASACLAPILRRGRTGGRRQALSGILRHRPRERAGGAAQSNSGLSEPGSVRRPAASFSGKPKATANTPARSTV